MDFSTLISAETLCSQYESENWILVDCRFDMNDTHWGFRAYQDGHIPGAVYAHLDKDLCGGPATDRGRHPLPTPEEMSGLFSRLGIHNHSQVVAYDDSSGAFAARLWWMLRFMNHEKAAVLDGGLGAWVRAGFPLMKGIESNPEANFQGDPQFDRLVIMDDVPTLSILIDSRAPERYRGEMEPIDPVAGHIPGAVNYFYKNNWSENGLFLPQEMLRQQIDQVIDRKRAEEVTYYCGSGVTACVNVLAQEHAGLGTARLYVGSWGEWCRTPGKPVAKKS